MRSVAGGVIALALAGLVAACTGEDHIDVGSVERDLEALTQEVSAIPVTASCPSDVANEAGTDFRCRVTAYGRSYVVRGEVTEPSGEGNPWEFDEDDLHVGPASLTCAQLQEDKAWTGVAAQLLAREPQAGQAEPGAAQLQAVAKLFLDECRAAPAGLVPYPIVATRLANP